MKQVTYFEVKLAPTFFEVTKKLIQISDNKREIVFKFLFTLAFPEGHPPMSC